MPDSFIEFKDVAKNYGKNPVLDGINLQIQKGERFGIIGVSGSGKSTLLNILVGFIKQNRGNIFVEGRDLTKEEGKLNKVFGFATQDGSFYDKLSVEENLIYFGKMYGMSIEKIRDRIDYLLKLVELDKSKKTLARNLSRGMKRRLDIACALIQEPKVLILDEPTEDLDPRLRREIISLIVKINQEEQATIIITSHLLREMENVCTKLAILHDGKIITTGNVDQIKRKCYEYEEINLQTYPGDYKKLADSLGSRDIVKVTVTGNKMTIHTSNPEDILRRLLLIMKNYKEKLIDIEVSKPSLEEAFERLTEKK